MSSRTLARAAVFAALYAGLTLAPGLNGLAYGPVQFRAAEGLLPFACVDPAAVLGLTAGTAIANVASPMGIYDVIFGTLFTLVAAAIMYRAGLRIWALAAPVVVNGLGVGAELWLVLHYPLWSSVGWVAAGEAGVMASVGIVVLLLVRRYKSVLGLTECVT
jgi:uncharacterized membrane protein